MTYHLYVPVYRNGLLDRRQWEFDYLQNYKFFLLKFCLRIFNNCRPLINNIIKKLFRFMFYPAPPSPPQ